MTSHHASPDDHEAEFRDRGFQHIRAREDVEALAGVSDTIFKSRVAARLAYVESEITLAQYNEQQELCNELVLGHIKWYKKRHPNFDELGFIGRCGDPAAVF